MYRIFSCRRTFVSVLAILILAVLGVWKRYDVSGAIATVGASLAGANSLEKTFQRKESP